MLVFTKQIDPISLTAFVQNASSGSAFSGNLNAYAQNSGTFGPNIVDTYTNQSITGIKTFLLSPIIPYSGGLLNPVSAQWSLDQISTISGFTEYTFVHKVGTETISGNKTFFNPIIINSPTATGHAVNLGYLTGMSGVFMTQIISTGNNLDSRLTQTGTLLSAIKVSGSSIIPIANFTGLGGTVIIYSGNNIFISGGAGGGGGGNVDALSGYLENYFVNRYSDQFITGNKVFDFVNGGPGSAGQTSFNTDAYFSGRAVIVNDPTLALDAVNLEYLLAVSGALASATPTITNVVHQTGNETISGYKIFTGAIGVANPTTTGQAVNLGYLTGVSGVLRNAGGTVTNNYSFSGITGNYVSMSFFFDQYNLVTGLALVEAFVSRDFFFTGYALGAYSSGTQGIISGSIYQRNTSNIKTQLSSFSFNSGLFFYASGGFNTVASGMNRIGIDITSLGTGVTGFSIGAFGVGY